MSSRLAHVGSDILSLAALILLSLVVSGNAGAATTAGLTYQGRIVKPSGEPLETAGVQFRIQIRTPNAGNCLLFQESKTVNMIGSGGLFNISINDGTGSVLSGSYSLDEVFSNRKSFNVTHPNLDCVSSTTYNPSPTDGRKFIVEFKEPSAVDWEVLGPMDINYVPQALEAVKVGGFGPEDLLRVERSAAQTVNAFSFTDYGKLVDLIAGTSNLYQKPNQLNGVSVPTLSNGQVLGWSGGAWSALSPVVTESDPLVQTFAKTTLPTCATGEVLRSNGTALSCVAGGSVATASTSVKGIVQIDATGGISVDGSGVISLPDTVTAGNYVRVLVDTKGRVTSGQTTLSDTYLDTITTSGKVSGSAITSGNISTSGNFTTSGSISSTGNISSSGNISATGSVSGLSVRLYDGSSNYLTHQAPPMATDYALTWPAALPASDKLLQVSSTGVLSWADAGGTITDVTVSPPLSKTGTTAPALSIPAASGTQNGYLSSADWTNFDSKLGTTLASGNLFVGNGSSVATAVAASGDVSLVAGGAFTVTRVRANPVDTGTLVLAEAGKVYKWDGDSFAASFIGVGDLKKADGSSQIPAACSAGNTMTWSSLTDTFVCSTISITKSQVSDLGTIGTAASRDTGTSSGNVPVLDGTGKIPAALLPSMASTPGGADQQIQFNNSGAFGGSDRFLWTNTTRTLSIAETGQTGTISFGSAVSISGSATGINFNGSMQILAGGNVGIGTASPGEKLQVAGNVGADSFVQTSDRRLKRKIASIDGLTLVKQLRGVKYERIATGKSEYGLIAQEVEAVAPELVSTNSVTGIKGVHYQNLVSPLIEAVKQTDLKCENLAVSNQAMLSKIEDSEKRIRELEVALSKSQAENQIQLREMKALIERLVADKDN